MIDIRDDKHGSGRNEVRSLAAWKCPAVGQHQKAQGEEQEEMHECRGTIKKVLDDGEVTQLKDLFAMVEREGPRGDMLGVIDLSESPECAACPERLSWGYTAYCQNVEKLREIRSQAGTEPRTEPGL
jgi:hypothetical protein